MDTPAFLTASPLLFAMRLFKACGSCAFVAMDSFRTAPMESAPGVTDIFVELPVMYSPAFLISLLSMFTMRLFKACGSCAFVVMDSFRTAPMESAP